MDIGTPIKYQIISVLFRKREIKNVAITTYEYSAVTVIEQVKSLNNYTTSSERMFTGVEGKQISS